MSVLERTWTAARVAQLKSCFDAGLSCSRIADEIGVSRNAVIGKINRLRLAPRNRVIAKPRQRKVGLRLVTQHDILAALRSAPPPAVEDVPVPNQPRCSGRAERRKMPLADQRSGHAGLRLLRRQGRRWPAVLRGARPHRLSAGRRAAPRPPLSHLPDSSPGSLSAAR